MLTDSPFFFKYSIDDIKRKEDEKLWMICDVSLTWFFLYHKSRKFENFYIK
jgi:hypothetical protein